MNAFLLASYHLNKETQEKTGSLQELVISDANKIECSPHSQEFPYGILSLKQEEDLDLFSMGCSDGLIRLLRHHPRDQELTAEVRVYGRGDEKNKNVCLMHDSSERLIAGSYQDGSVTVFDKETGGVLCDQPKLHQYEAWYTHLSDTTLYSCSDDCSFKALDTRSNSLIFTCKKHDAGVTWLSTLHHFDAPE